MKENNHNDILYFDFNQDKSCFAVGTEEGFLVVNSHPVKEIGGRFLEGGIGVIKMLNRSNILALVGGGANPFSPPNTVLIWEDNEEEDDRVQGEITLNSEVKNLSFSLNNLLAVTKNRCYVYNFSKLNLIKEIETCENNKGIFAVNINESMEMVMAALPDLEIGAIQLIFFDERKNEKIKIFAHDSPLAAIEISSNGSLIASASEKGTIIRVFSTRMGEQKFEFRRGTNTAIIYSIAFSPACAWLACSSNTGTVHVYSLEEKGNKNAKSALSFLPMYYFKSEWNFAHYELKTSARSLIGFITESTFVILTAQGKYYRVKFDTNQGGYCLLETEKEILNLEQCGQLKQQSTYNKH